jgi:hypothetical protein
LLRLFLQPDLKPGLSFIVIFGKAQVGQDILPLLGKGGIPIRAVDG